MPDINDTQFVEPKEIGKETTVQEQPKTETVKPETTKVVEPTETKTEDESAEDAIVNFSDFLEQTGEQIETASETPPKLETKPAETKVETKVEVKTEKKEEVKEEETKGRDYSDLDESVVPLFKKMGNESFKFFKPLYQESIKLKAQIEEQKAEVEKLRKGGLPDSYFEHPRGYTLSKEFETYANTAIQARQIVDHWSEQLDKIRKGDETYQEIHINNGEFYVSKPIQATKESEREVLANLDFSKQQLSKYQVALEGMATAHSNKVKESITALQAFENDAFKNFAGENAKAIEPLIKDTITKVLPPAFQNNPLARVLAKSLLTIQQLGLAYKKLQESGVKVESKNGEKKVAATDDKRKAGPNASDMSAGSSSGGEDSISFDDFIEAGARP